MNQDFAQAMQRFIEHIRQRHPTSSTATHYQNDLEQFVRVVDKAPRAVTRADVSRFVTAQLTEALNPATINRRLATLSSFFEFLADEAGDDQWANPVVWSVHGVHQGRHLPRDLSETVARQFWQTVQSGPVRDQAMVALMLDVGLRVNEVVTLCVPDFEPAPRAGAWASLRVHGKGDKERRIWLVAETAALLQPVLWPGTGDWLAQRPAVADEALFLTRRATPFTVRGLQDRVKHYAVQAGLPPEQVSCHRLRHTLRQAQGRLFARRMAEAQMPLPSLSHWLGHSQLKTTQVYIDGASPEVRADYQAAMARLAQQAERPPSPPAAVAPPIATAESSAETTTAETAQLTAAEIESPIAQLPAWLQCPIVAFLQAQQMRWQPYHRRSRARQWLGELRRAWTWLCAERQLTGWAALRRSDLSAYLTYCREQGLSNGTINHFLTTFWAFLHFVEAQGEPITPGLYRVPRPPQPDWQPRPLSEAEYARLVRAVTTTTARDAPEAAARDRCWFLILSEGGLRISELVTLTMADWDAPAQTLTIHQGKNGHERRIPISERTAQAIESHLAGRPYEPKAPLVIHRGQAVRADYIRERLHAFAAQAQLEGITPHRLRHTYATRLLNGGGIPITTLQKLLGHRRIDTTMLYTAIYDQTLQRDYAAAVAHLQAQSQPDANWDPWSPVVEEALARTSTTPTPTPEPVTTANCM